MWIESFIGLYFESDSQMEGDVAIRTGMNTFLCIPSIVIPLPVSKNEKIKAQGGGISNAHMSKNGIM